MRARLAIAARLYAMARTCGWGALASARWALALAFTGSART